MLNKLAQKIHDNAKNKGFWDNPRETGTLLMLIVSEISEAMEADRKDKHADIINWQKDFDCWKIYKNTHHILNPEQIFEQHTKDTFEDEIADATIRILDLCAYLGIDLEWHINAKMAYNEKREKMHGGKKY